MAGGLRSVDAWFRSIYGTTERCPSPDENLDACLDFMLKLVRGLQNRAALIPTSDQFVQGIGALSDTDLSERYHISPSAKIQAELALKEGQLRLAAAHGLPIPLTRHASTEADVEAFAFEANFPCLIKPQQQRYWSGAPESHPLRIAKVLTAESAVRLLEQYRIAAAFSPDVVLQEVIQGPDTNKRCHMAVYGRDGKRIGALTLKEFRNFPMIYGSATVVEPIDGHPVDAAYDRFLHAIRYTGICEIEVKRDQRNGAMRAMDINPRFSGTGDAASYAGLDTGWLHYLDLIGERVEPVALNGRNFRHIMLRNDVTAIRHYGQARMLSWADVRRAYRRPFYFFDLDFRDWRLAANTLWRSFRVLAGWLITHLRPSQAR